MVNVREALARRERERSLLADRLARLLAGDPRVLAGWLHGSVGRGEADGLSDLDVTVVVADERGAACCRAGPAYHLRAGTDVRARTLGDRPGRSHAADRGTSEHVGRWGIPVVVLSRGVRPTRGRLGVGTPVHREASGALGGSARPVRHECIGSSVPAGSRQRRTVSLRP